jgi:hypothetical protein
MDADDRGPAVAGADADADAGADADGDHTTAVELIADTLAGAVVLVSPGDEFGGDAAQAPTEIATMAATLALTTTDEDRIYGASGRGV